ncbi:MFS transporter [Rhabdothermincola salaria]|uniref:MFS transporter n=1 Tax=Rhabdothermincola salaria TaxID=2903142 RepID=UPI001E4C86E6|nr:MFS transporter [Rhabdothermincola salaria]MCD9625674.1 MFS transporter [Rhabdothermincola salaria]
MSTPVATSSVRRVTLAASATLTVAVLPVFLVGSLSADIGRELGFGTAGTGVAITGFFAAGGLTAVGMGRVTDRVGAKVAMRAGVVLSGICTLALGTIATQLWQLVVLLGLAGTAIGLVDTGGARSFSEAVRFGRQGLAFGIKEASVPAASMLAGLSLPVLADALGWQWAFVVGAALAPAVWFLVPPDPVPGDVDHAAHPASPDTDAPHRSTTRRATLVLFAVGVAFGAGASSAAATLFVPAVSDAGWTENAAGVLLAIASIASIATRLGLGWSSDLAPQHIRRMLAGALALGALGAALLAVSSAPAVVVAGALLVLGAGWGWSGLAFLRAVRATPEAPSIAAGIVLTGLATGGTVGPALFGVIASRWSYTASWWSAAGALAIAAAVAVVVRDHAASP